MADDSNDFSRVFSYAVDFYVKRQNLIILFSIPFILATLIVSIVSAPTYMALGAVFLRTGSIPELSVLDIIITALGYALAVFIISDSIVNINIIIRSKRTVTQIRSDIVEAVGTHATRLFYIYTLLILLMFIVQLVTYDNPFQSWIYPIFLLVVSFVLFFVAPAVVIDNSDTPTAIRRSFAVAMKKPHMVAIWTLFAFVALSITEVFGNLIFSSPFSSYFTLLVNSLFVLPFLIVLQTQMYMEKYPLAR
jgi:hypothetical protein